MAEQTSEYRVEPARIPTTTIPAVVDVDPLEHVWARGPRPPGPGEARPEANGTDRAAIDPRASDRGGSRIDPGTGPDAEPDGHVGWHIEELARLLGDRDGLARMDAAAVQARIRHLRRVSGLADAALAAAVAALDRVGGVAADGAASKAEWLKANTGRSGRDAARMERLANNLECLPATAQALADGRLSAEAADAVVGAARDGRLGSPDRVEEDLLSVATDRSPEHLRRHIRARQQQADGGALLRDEKRQRARRGVSMARQGDGMWNLGGRLTGEVGDKFATMMDAFDQPIDRSLPGPDQPRPDQRRHDALERAVDAVLDRGLVPGTGGITRPHLSVIVPASTLGTDLARPPARADDGPNGSDDAGQQGDLSRQDADRSGQASGPVVPDDPAWAALAPGETPFGGLLSPQAVRRIACDASISRIVLTARSQVLDVGRATRNWSGPQRRAVNARDRGCRGPNCSRPIAWTQVHHLQWWRHDGVTSVANGLALCHHCHHLVHDRGWTVSLDVLTSEATWTRPDGVIVVTRPRAGPAPLLPVTPTTPPTRVAPAAPATPTARADRPPTDNPPLPGLTGFDARGPTG